MNNIYRTLIIFDWDDTLFPTTWLVQNNIDLADKDMQNKYIIMFSRLDNLLHRLLLAFSNKGQTVIVTNASIKWIDVALNMLPNTKQIIKNKTLYHRLYHCRLYYCLECEAFGSSARYNQHKRHFNSWVCGYYYRYRVWDKDTGSTEGMDEF